MKKLTELLLTLTLTLTMSTAAFAAEAPANEPTASPVESAQTLAASETDTTGWNGDEPADDLFPRLSDGVPGTGHITSPLEHWNLTGWPDDVSFAFEAGGEMAADGAIRTYWEIGLVHAPETRKQEILELFADTCLITFHDAAWSHAQREAALLEIEEEVKNTHDSNFVRGDLIQNTDRLCIVVKDEAFAEYSARYAGRYGDLVWMQRESEMAEDALYQYAGDMGLGTGEDGTQASQNTWFLPGLLCALTCAAAAALWSIRLRPVSAKQTVNGAIVAQAKPWSRAQTIQAVRESTHSPSEQVLERIRASLSV